jgi:MurNAc alpha-1-phosphate uridylyltransferase
MEINKAIILCAGYGKRVLPLTKTTPKPLLTINEIPLIEYSIKVLKALGIKEVGVNVHHLKEKIINYLNKNYPKIKIFEEKIILDTGGALANAKNFLSDDYFIVLNSDTVWQQSYISNMKSLIRKTVENKFLAGLLLAKKENSFDPNLSADFSLENDHLINKKEFIYTGFQLLNSKLLNDKEAKSFSVKEIWDDLIENKKITGEIFDQTFYHTTDLAIYEKLKNKNIIF